MFIYPIILFFADVRAIVGAVLGAVLGIVAAVILTVVVIWIFKGKGTTVVLYLAYHIV